MSWHGSDNVLSLWNLHPFPLRKHAPITGTTPPQVALQLRADASLALERLDTMPPPGTDKEPRPTIGDLRAMAYLGTYYADKILGATEIERFHAIGNGHQTLSGH
jgi:hypothetical protein